MKEVTTMRMIDADALMQKWLDQPDPIFKCDEQVKLMENLCSDWIDLIKSAPTIEPSGDIFGKMRDATEEERKSVHDYIESISEPSGDLISRQRVINILRSICGSVCTINNDVVNEINAIPSAEVVSREEYDQLERLYDAIRIYDSSADRPSNVLQEKNPTPIEDYMTGKSRLADRPNDAIDHDREWIIGCIKHDGFIHTHRFDKANQIILDALADRPTGKWQHKPSKSGEWVWWQCSECGAVIYSESEADREIHHAYCGVCGERMVTR